MQHGASGRFGSSDHQQAGLALLGQRHRSLQLRPVAARGRAPPTCPGANRLTLHVLAAAAEHERHMIGERTRPPLAAAKARGVKLGNPEQAKINRAKAAARARALHQGWPRIKQCHRNRSQRARHRDTEWRRMVSGAGASRSSRPMIDRGVALPSVKVFSPAREHPLRTRFANISLRRAEFRKANFDGAARGQLCDRNVRDDFTQPSNSPDHSIKPVWRAINGAVPLAAEGHHFALELIEPAAMQDTLLFI